MKASVQLLLSLCFSLSGLAQTPWRIINGSLWNFSLIPTTTNSSYFVSGTIRAVVPQGGILVDRFPQKVIDPEFVLRGGSGDITTALHAQALLDRGLSLGTFMAQDERTRRLLLDHTKNFTEVIYVADATNSAPPGSEFRSYMLPRRNVTLSVNNKPESFPTYIIGFPSASTKGFESFTLVTTNGNKFVRLPFTQGETSNIAGSWPRQ